MHTPPDVAAVVASPELPIVQTREWKRNDIEREEKKKRKSFLLLVSLHAALSSVQHCLTLKTVIRSAKVGAV